VDKNLFSAKKKEEKKVGRGNFKTKKERKRRKI